MSKPYTTGMILSHRRGSGREPIVIVPATPDGPFVETGASLTVARFWIENRYGVSYKVARANALLFMLAHEMFELLEDLMPELIAVHQMCREGRVVIIDDRIEVPYLDIGRIQNMLRRIDALGQYTRKTTRIPLAAETDVYCEDRDEDGYGDFIASFYVIPQHPDAFGESFGMNHAMTQFNTRLFLKAPAMAEMLRNIMSGELFYGEIWRTLDFIRQG